MSTHIQTLPYGHAIRLDQPHAWTVQHTRAALAEEGFGVICEIDIVATLHSKLGVTVAPYVILGACNPSLAHRALREDLDIGLLLPCNVVVRAGDAPSSSEVAIVDAERMLGLARGAELAPIAREAAERLLRVLGAVASAAENPATAAPPELAPGAVEVADEIC